MFDLWVTMNKRKLGSCFLSNAGRILGSRLLAAQLQSHIYRTVHVIIPLKLYISKGIYVVKLKICFQSVEKARDLPNHTQKEVLT